MDLSKYPTKRDVAVELNISEKSVDRHTARGSLTRYTRPRAGMVSQSVYDPATVKRLKARLIAEREAELAKVSLAVEPIEPVEPETALSVARPASLEPVLEALARLPQHWALYLSWTDARRYSGLSLAALRAAVDAGEITTRAYGRGVRLRRRDLDKL